jgi:hypothetical protein
MAYSYVSYNFVNHGDTDDPSWAFDIGTRTNGFLALVIIQYQDFVTGVTWDGTAMSLASKQGDTPDYYGYIYYLENPSDGSNTMALAHSGDSLSCKTIAAWFDGGKQTSPLHIGSTGDFGLTGHPTVNITPTENNTLIIGGERNEENVTPTAGSGETEIYGYYIAGKGGGASYAIQTTAASQDVDWDNPAEDNHWLVVAASFLEAAAADERVIQLLFGGRQVLAPRSRL